MNLEEAHGIGHQLAVHKLSPCTNRQDILHYFTEFGGITELVLGNNGNDAFIRYASDIALKRAMSVRRHILNGTNIYTRVDEYRLEKILLLERVQIVAFKQNLFMLEIEMVPGLS